MRCHTLPIGGVVRCPGPEGWQEVPRFFLQGSLTTSLEKNPACYLRNNAGFCRCIHHRRMRNAAYALICVRIFSSPVSMYYSGTPPSKLPIINNTF